MASIQDIAQKVGVSRSAVSLALRNKPGISERMREKIWETAEELGYQFNPTVSRFMSQLRRSDMSPYRSTIAWLNMHSREEIIYPYWKEAFKGAQRKAVQMGYRLESFWLRDPDMTPKRLSRILVARGVSGLIVGPSDRPYSKLNLDWTSFSAVAMSFGLVRPELARISSNYHRSTLEALKLLRKRGYRRMGLFLVSEMAQRSNHGWEAGFYLFQNLHPQMMMLTVKIADQAECEIKDLCTWVETNQLDAVLSPHMDVFHRLKAGGMKIPEDLAFVSLDHEPDQVGIAGMDQQPSLMGEVAVKTLHGQIDSGANAMTSIPSLTLITARWVEGETVRPPKGA